MDIWQALQIEIRKATGESFVLSAKNSIAGGDINQAFKLTGNNRHYFVKLNSRDLAEMFKREAEGLDELRSSNLFTVPSVIAYGVFEQQSYLILQYINFNNAGSLSDFAAALAKLHLKSNSRFGFSNNNFIGMTPQNNHWNSDWGEFFSEQRIGYQLALLDKKLKLSNKSAALLDKGNRLIQLLAKYLNQHSPKPALVHGDLWQGNYGFDEKGTPAIYDPACYFADHEVELAMLELFSSVTDEFWNAYGKINNISQGYFKRKKIYNLYHILNHANLFGGHYIHQSESIIDEILLELD